ncbi:hypothetical protein HY333_01685 [Candidatus Collierbacteria bacterium]|nr:hypothetical protein [Candidatus Collierbacteria bacterium]
MNGIGKQVVSELAGIGKQVIADTTKAVGDVAGDTMEAVITGGSNFSMSHSVSDGASQESGNVGNDPLQALKKQNAIKAQNQLRKVQDDLEQFILRKKQKEEQQEKAKEEQVRMAELQMKESEKRRRQKGLIRSIQHQYGGTGEGVKKKF